MTSIPGPQVLDSFQEDDWTAFVRRHPDATFYHTLDWRDFIADVFGHRPVYLAAGKAGRLVAILPLFHVRVPLVGSKLISLPYDIGSGGALADDATGERLLVSRAIELARDLGVAYLELRPGLQRPALAPLRLRTQEPVLISDMVLDGDAAVRGRIAADHRKAIRKAAGRGVVVRTADTLADYDAFYDVYLRVFRDFGTPPYGRRYFRALWTRLRPKAAVRLFLAEAGGRCVGGLVLFQWERSLVSKFAACLPEAVPLRAYAALYWHAIEYGLAQGCQRLSWGTSSRDQRGLIEFKERWGATTRPAVLYDLDVASRAPDIASYYESGGLRRSIWRRLPLVVTQVGGGLLNRWYC